MDQEDKKENGSSSSNNNRAGLDSLTALNIVPFLGLMNLLEIRYLHMPEVYRTMLAILCDYDPGSQENIIRTRRYIGVLLAREPELAQCLLNFLDTPDETAPSTTQTSASNALSMLEYEGSWQRTPSQGPSAQLTETTVASVHNVTSEQEALPCDPEKRDGQLIEYRCLSSAMVSSATTGQQQQQQYGFTKACSTTVTSTTGTSSSSPHMNLQSLITNSHPPTSSSNSSGSDPASNKSVPIVNIYYKDLLATEKTVVVGTRPSQPQSTQFILPSSKLPHMSCADGGGVPAGSLEHAKTGLAAAEHRDQVVLTSTITSTSSSSSSCQRKTEMAAHSAPFLPQGIEVSNTKKDKQCSVAQTQTTSMITSRATLPQERTSSTETAFKASRHTTATTSSESASTVASGSQQQSAVSQNIRISKLLGQPSVSYLPAGHFIENRNAIIGTAATRPTGAGMDRAAYSPSLLGDKMNSASAKLHLLSTQAGNDKSGTLNTGPQKPMPSISTSNSSIMSVSLPSTQRDAITKTTTMKVISKPGGRKTITLSKILPVVKLDTGGQDAKTTTVSFDKQIQVDERQICKKIKPPGRKEHPIMIYSDMKQLPNNPHIQEASGGKQSLTDWQKDHTALQSTITTENNSVLEKSTNQKEIQSPSRSQAHPSAIPKESNTTSLKEQPVSGKPAASNDAGQTGKQQQDQVMIEAPHNPKPGQDEEGKEEKSGNTNTEDITGGGKEKPAAATSAALLEKIKHSTQKAGCSRPRVQVVTVGPGGSHSTFPYIQQLVLPDGHVSTITHNLPSSPARQLMAQPQPQPHKAVTTTTTNCTSTSTSTTQAVKAVTVCHTTTMPSDGKEPAAKPVTKIVLPKGGLQLSVSIPKPVAASYGMSTRKKQKMADSQTQSQEKPNTKEAVTETAQTILQVMAEKGQEMSCKTSSGKNDAVESTTMPAAAKSDGNVRVKRTRSPSTRRKTAKAMKF